MVGAAVVGTSGVAHEHLPFFMHTPVPTVGSICAAEYTATVTVPIDRLPGCASPGGLGVAKRRGSASSEPRIGVRPAGMRRPSASGREPSLTMRGRRQHRPSRSGHGARRSPCAPEALVREGSRRGKARPGGPGTSERVRASQE